MNQTKLKEKKGDQKTFPQKISNKKRSRQKASTQKASTEKTLKKKNFSEKSFQTQYIFVTGGVVSSIGKGLSAASLGALLQSRGYSVTIMKCDPYLNVDPGTMSPFQHGEVYVTDDGAETDLDLGHYERFISTRLTKAHSVTAGQVYDAVISKERKGDYLGGTVQVIPHITDHIKEKIKVASQGFEIALVEIGGTVGDIEGLPFLEAIRQMRGDLGPGNSLLMHVTYVPYIKVAGELKSKPTQHSVKELREIGLQPDILICRSESTLDDQFKKKTALFCSVDPDCVIAATDAQTIYEVPLILHREQLDTLVLNKLHLKVTPAKLDGWQKVVKTLKTPKKKVSIAIVGKYVDLKESYKSLHEAVVHAGIANQAEIDVTYIDSEKITAKNLKSYIGSVHGILVPGGFGNRGVEGKLLAIRWARENKIPFFGICYGMQLAAIEFARNVCGVQNALSREWLKPSEVSDSCVIDISPEQKNVQVKGGTMRLGSFPCQISQGSLVYKEYKTTAIYERHRHRYEFNNNYRPLMEKKGFVFSGIFKARDLVEIVEIRNHPWFVGVQFHPEFKSRPLDPHPLFVGFIRASLQKAGKKAFVL
jgi:CTP synthase